jgi:replicative DNA helicase
MSTSRRDKKSSREEFYGDVVRMLKNLAKQENIFVVLLSQLSRDHDSKEPSPDYLRGSGQILEGCDNCYLIFRPEATGSRYSGKYANVDPKGTAQIQVCKCRNGQVWQKYILGFKGEQTQFHELSSAPLLSPNSQKSEDDPF